MIEQQKIASKLSIRGFDVADYPTIAAIKTAIDPDWAITGEMLARWDEVRNPTYFFRRLMVEHESQVVGVGVVSENEWFHKPGRYVLDVAIDPQWQRQGIGSWLYNQLVLQIADREATELQVTLSSRLQPGLQFLERRGFRESWRRIQSRLDTATVDVGRYSTLEDTIASHGISLITFADVANPQSERRLYELDMEVSKDIPFGDTPTIPSFEHYRKDFFEDPEFVPEACFIAVRDGEWLGFTCFGQKPEGYLIIGMTGVKRQARGLGLAKWLKLQGVRYAQQHGNLPIRTFNDTKNQTILAMNRAMGFVEYDAIIILAKNLNFTEEKSA
jgi:mycothiol synthase